MAELMIAHGGRMLLCPRFPRIDFAYRFRLSISHILVTTEGHPYHAALAQVLKLVDKLDLGSSVLVTCEFESRPGHQLTLALPLPGW